MLVYGCILSSCSVAAPQKLLSNLIPEEPMYEPQPKDTRLQQPVRASTDEVLGSAVLVS